MRDYFEEVAAHLHSRLRGREAYTLNFHGETSHFVRFRRGAVRQAGSVLQRVAGVDWIQRRRHASGGLTLSGSLETDRARLDRLVEELRATARQLPEDPHLHDATEPQSTEHQGESRPPEPESIVEAIAAAAGGRDLVGIYAAGGMYAGFANSRGQRNWFATHSYHFDWSFHHVGGGAAKGSYAGASWDADEFERRVERSRRQFAALGRPCRPLEPGRYRVYLAPSALYEIVEILAWGGFGLRAHRTRSTPLLRMIEDRRRLAPSLHVAENTRDGLAPPFQSEGFLKPARVDLIRGGQLHDCLVSPRSAVEYGVPTNGAGEAETPDSIDVASGALASERVLRELQRGIYVSNLWYLNYSDRSACRATGMTRFATFWVENGALAAPIPAMRFDETLYRMLGENLIGLTRERELILDPNTYDRRSTRTARLPGALIDEFTLTL